jgi:hypothetical protein
MAYTRVQLEVEDRVRREWMLNRFGQRFSRERVRLSSGGFFDADAVSEDQKTIATISTSGARTSGGKNVIGKMLKIRSDMYFLLRAETERRLVILTESDMYAQFQKELPGGEYRRTLSSSMPRYPMISVLISLLHARLHRLRLR